MKLTLEKQIPLVFGIAILLLVVVIFFAFRSVNSLGETLKWEKHTQEVLLKLDETLVCMVNAEASARGFLITTDETILQPYGESRQKISGTLANLRSLIADNPSQIKRAARLDELMTERFALLGQIVETRRTKSLDETRAQFINGRGSELSDEIRQLIDEMKAEEQKLLVVREGDLNESIRTAYRMLFLAGIAGIVSLGLANFAIFREIGKRRQAESKLRDANKGLESRVADRTDELSKRNDELKEQIKKSAEAEQRRRLALEAGSLGTWRLHADTADGEMDERSLSLFGLTAADFKGTSKHAFSRIVEEDAPHVDEKFRRAVVEKSAFNAEFRIKNNNNEIRWNNCTGNPQFDENGNLTHIVGFCRDTTANKENELALQRNESFVRTILDSLPSHIAVLDQSGTIIAVNKAWKSFAEANCVEEQSDRTGIGQNYLKVCENSEAFDENTKFIVENLRAILRGEKEKFLFEYPCHSPDEERWFILEASRMADGAVISHIDISERRRIEREKEILLENEQAARKEAEIANRLRDEFLATVSHELRAPLNSILGWGRLLEKGKLDELTTGKAVTTIIRNAEAQNRLIEDLLDVSRIISGKLRLEVMTVKPVLFVESALETVRPAADAKNINLEIRETPDVSHISGDPNRLQQVVWNLLSNAIKFTPNGGNVLVEIERAGDAVEIRVKDTGVGIKPEFLPHVFDRFSQADASSIRKFGGLGLGLAIVRHITEMHGGTVEVASDGENQGTTFVVKLPVITSPVDDDNAGDNKSAEAGMMADKEKINLDGLLILVVDDEEDTRQLLVQSLTFYGATVVAASSAQKAFEAVINQNPDVLVSDIGMPDEDGYSLIRRVRSLDDKRCKNLPAIALTAFTRAQDRMRTLTAGYQSHVSKPVEPDELATVIASLTGRLQLDDETDE